MRTASPVRSPLACTICLKFLDDSVIAKAYLFCRLPTLPLALLLPPSPHPPSPPGKGEIFSFLMQGAPPLASPRLSRKRHGLNLRDKCPEGACPLCHLPPLPVACFSAPPPSPKGKDSPLPALAERSSLREGGDYKFILPGAPPPAPRHQTAYGTDSPCRCSTPEGGLPSWSPANPAFSLLFCPFHRRGRIDSPAPIPLPALAERSSRREGGILVFLCKGLRPLHSRA